MQVYKKIKRVTRKFTRKLLIRRIYDGYFHLVYSSQLKKWLIIPEDRIKQN